MVARTPWLGTRRGVLLLIALAGLWSAWHLNLNPLDLADNDSSWQSARDFFAAAFQPAFTYENADQLPDDAAPLLLKAAAAGITTLLFAAAAIGLSIALAIPLAFVATASWQFGDPASGDRAFRGPLRRIAAGGVYVAARFVIAAMRSVHELLWAVLFVAAMGLTPLAAVFALTIPYAGTLAKIYSEIIDESPRAAADTLRMTGASPMRVFFVGLVPRALPDMIAYTLYRFECSLRSSAVMGFFGIATLGQFIRLAEENVHHREVWTYLYFLIAMIVAVDLWSNAIRRRIVHD